MKNSTLRWLIIILMLVGIWGCNAPTGNSRNFAEPATPAINPTETKNLLAAAVNKRKITDTLVASGDMRIQDRSQKFSLGVQIENLAAVYPNRLRIKATKLAGAVDAFDILMRDDNIAFFVPRQKTLYVGKITDLQNASAGLNFSPEILLSRLLRGNRALLNYDWQISNNSNRNFTELEQTHNQGNNYLRVTIDRRQQVITKIIYLTPANLPYFTEEYGDYREIGGGLFPTRFGLVWQENDRFMRLNLKNPDLTRSATAMEEAFSGIDNLDMDKITRLPLQQARVESDEIK